MKIGMITCNYYMRIYNYEPPAEFEWGEMCGRYRAEFTRADFLTLAKEIREIGFDGLEIWEPMFSYKKYSEAEAASVAEELRGMGFGDIVYCIGGWGAGDVEAFEPAYRFAKAMGAKVISGCISLDGAETILPEIEACGEKYGIRYAIENHPAPSVETPEDVARLTAPFRMIGANLDTGIFHMLGYDLLKAAELLKDKTFHVHLKDTVKSGQDCLPLGEGSAPLAELGEKLKQWGYQGMLSVEMEYLTDPAPGLAKSLAYLAEALA